MMFFANSSSAPVVMGSSENSPEDFDEKPLEIRSFESPANWLGRPMTWDPDEPRFDWGAIGGRMHSMLGGHLSLLALRKSNHKNDTGWGITVGLSPFIELVNIDAEDLVPWQTFRGSIALAMHSAVRPRFKHLRGLAIFVDFRFAHESDHADWAVIFDSSGIPIKWASDRLPVGGEISSFEYLEIRPGLSWTMWQRQLRIHVWTEGRLFTPPFIGFSHRRPAYSLSTELGIRSALGSQLWLTAGWNYEWMVHREPVSPGNSCEQPQCSHSHRLRTGLVYSDRSKRELTVYAAFDQANGRGLDFAWEYGNEWGGGVMWSF